jgi:LmbE family N-acetylglucosaminyl deacetylase
MSTGNAVRGRRVVTVEEVVEVEVLMTATMAMTAHTALPPPLAGVQAGGSGVGSGGRMLAPMNTRRPRAAELGTILSVWAHPDDETYLAAGVMAGAADRGQRVVCVSATAGEHGTSDPHVWPPDRLARVRRWEAAAAMAVLGVAEHRILGLPDGRLADHHEHGLAMVGELLDEVRPDTILTFGADGMTFHPDHVVVHRWVTEAWERRGRPCRLLYATPTAEHLDRFGELYEQWGSYMTDERPTGIGSDDLSVHVLLGGWRLDRKLTALRALASQTGPLLARLDPAVYAEQVAEEAFVDAVRAA